MSDNEQRNENRDTLDDVLAEMLERADAMQTHGTTHGVRLAILEFVSRIKAAWKRERANVEADALAVGGLVEAARTAEKSSAVGNATKMREALEEILLICYKAGARYGYDVACGLIKAKAKNALAAPPRQCDAGTADEQAERMRLYCNSHGEDESGCFRCEKCPFLTDESCELAWAQMPYEAQEGGRS